MSDEWIKTSERLPEKPGKASYEHVECLIVVNGLVKPGLWNCEHECWDDADGDDFLYDAFKPTHWQPLPSPPTQPIDNKQDAGEPKA